MAGLSEVCRSCRVNYECSTRPGACGLPGGGICLELLKGPGCSDCRELVPCREKDRWRVARAYLEIAPGDQLCAKLLGVEWTPELVDEISPVRAKVVHAGNEQLSLF